MSKEVVHEKILKHLLKSGAKVKVIDANTDPMGYSGMNATIPTKSGLHAEIQVNSDHMIYAKEPEVLAKQLIGEARYNEIASKTRAPGGLGHHFYEEWRSLPLGDPGRDKIEARSRAYYHKIRSRVQE